MARDPKRIDEILNRLKRLWLCYPDLRFGQLVSNIISGKPQPQFYIEDDEFVTAIEDYQKQISGRV
jgi:hypothetical protein